MFKKRKTVRHSVHKVLPDQMRRERDLLAVEEPLNLLWQGRDGPVERLTATMRTPGEDNELAAGLLYSEGLLLQRQELELFTFCASGARNELNRLRAVLRLPYEQARERLAHRPSASPPQSACGLCAHDELGEPGALVSWAKDQAPPTVETVRPPPRLLQHALHHLHSRAPLFAATGASHAVVIVDPAGNLLSAGEDVGRHNACDKAIGTLFLGDSSNQRFRLPSGSGILFSSRLSFELAAKAVRAGAAWMASVGAPTHLAVELADRCGLPTLGFCSEQRHNVYVG